MPWRDNTSGGDVTVVTRVKRTVTIAAPPSRVFAFLCDPESLATINSPWIIDDVTDLPGGLHRTRMHRTDDGVTLRAENESIECVPYTKVVVRSQMDHPEHGPVLSTVTNVLIPIGKGTRLTRTRERQVRKWYPNGVIANVLASLHAHRALGNVVSDGLEKLKLAVEAAIDREESGTTYPIPRVCQRPILSRQARRLTLAACVVVATAIYAVLTLLPANTNSPSTVASAYVKAMLDKQAWNSPCSFVLPAVDGLTP